MTLISDAQLVTMNERREVLHADLRIENGKIVEIGHGLVPRGDEKRVSAKGCFVIPGLIQAHTHLCQTLFRGLADDLELLDWLQKKIWPLEKAHTEESLRASAQIGLMEMQCLGTTAILDMGTVALHHVVFEEAERSGMRYWGGNCLMDIKATSGPLYRERVESLNYCAQLIREWHLKTPLLQYAVSPRFSISCSDKLMRGALKLQQEHGLLMHTHASENKKEVAAIKKRTGLNNVQYLQNLGLLTDRAVIAHGIHLTPSEIKAIVTRQTGVTHCPSSNLKLASGVAPITRYLEQGMKVALGSDGAACNNNMDPFLEMRLAALLQKQLFGPTALPAIQAFELATLGGARVLNCADQVGSLVVGKRADVVIVRRNHPSVATVDDPYSALVYSSSGRDVSDVWIDGRHVVENGAHAIYDAAAVTAFARRELAGLLGRLSSGRNLSGCSAPKLKNQSS